MRRFVSQGTDAVADERLATLVRFARKVNGDPSAVEDGDVEGLRKIGLTDKGIVQLVHLVGDFASYNRLNIALDTDYDYRDMWREVAFRLRPGPGIAPGDNTRGVRSL